MSPQPPLGQTKVRADRLDQPPEAPRMILLFQVHQLMQEHVITNRRRHLHEPIVQRNSPGARARSPSRPLVSNRQSRNPQAVFDRQRVQSPSKLVVRKGSEIAFDAAPKVIRPAVQDDGPVPIPNDSAAAPIETNLHRHQLPTEHCRCPRGPGRCDGDGLHTFTLGRDPGTMPMQEAHGFGP